MERNVWLYLPHAIDHHHNVNLLVCQDGPSYFGPLLRGDIARPLVIQIHGIVFVGWMALLLVQVVVVYRGRTRLHRRTPFWLGR